MHVLVLGGSSFVGRHIVEAALAHGDEVTLFNRGLTGPHLFPGCEHLIGDRRAGDLAALRHGTWDAVVDVCGYVAPEVAATGRLLEGRVGRYCFISTGAVYVDPSVPADESAPLVRPRPGPASDAERKTAYAALKVACEQALHDVFGAELLTIRPGVVVGPHDPTDRFTYWVRRVAVGGTLLGPPRPEQPVQVVHARDQADLVIGLLADGARGPFNCAGPSLSFAQLLQACADAAGRTADVVWGGPATLPLSTPPDGSHDGAYRMSSARADAAGLHHRDLVATCGEILAWDRDRGRPPLRSDMPTPADEERMLDQLVTTSERG